MEKLKSLGVGRQFTTQEMAKLIDEGNNHTSASLSNLLTAGILRVASKMGHRYVWEIKDLSIEYVFGSPTTRPLGYSRKKLDHPRKVFKISDFSTTKPSPPLVLPLVETPQEAAEPPEVPIVQCLEEFPQRLHTALAASAKALRGARAMILAEFTEVELLDELRRRHVPSH